MWFSGFSFFYSVSHSWGVPTMKITVLSILCKWENLKNRQCIKYLFAPLCVYVCISVVKNIDISINIDTEISERYQY